MPNNIIKDVPYYKKRFDIILSGSLVVLVFQLFYHFNFDTSSITFSSPYEEFKFLIQLSKNWIFIPIICFILIAICFFAGSNEKFSFLNFGPYTIKPILSLFFLVCAAIFYIILVSFPIIYTGGPQKSVFGAMIITMAGLIVIITDSNPLRLSFSFIILSIHLFLTFISLSQDKIINSELESWYYFTGMIIIIIITINLGWHSRTIFDSEDDRLIINRKTKEGIILRIGDIWADESNKEWVLKIQNGNYIAVHNPTSGDPSVIEIKELVKKNTLNFQKNINIV